MAEKALKNLDDAYKWSLETVDALKAGDFSRIDMDELICEIGAIASGLKREMWFLLTQVLESKLTLAYGDGTYEKEASDTLVEAQARLQSLFFAAPTLREALPEGVKKVYPRARESVETLDGLQVPKQNPFPIEEIVEDPYDRLVAKDRVA